MNIQIIVVDYPIYILQLTINIFVMPYQISIDNLWVAYE